MKYRLISIIIFAAGILQLLNIPSEGVPTLRSDERDVYNDKMYNGNHWMDLNSIISHGEVYGGTLGKLAFVRGLFEGAWTIDPVKTKQEFLIDVKYGVIVQYLDQFYSNRNNLEISVADAIKIVTMQLRGEPSTEIIRRLNKLREPHRQASPFEE